MERIGTDAKRVEVWLAMADHFLDTETRHQIPATALACVEAGLGVKEARQIWRYEVSRAVGCNLWAVAGEWVGWEPEWLVQRIERLRTRWDNTPGTLRWLRYQLRSGLLEGSCTAIGRCIDILTPVDDAVERRRMAAALGALARHYFDFCPGDLGGLGAAERDLVRSLHPEPFTEAMAPAAMPGERILARRRVRVALEATDDRARGRGGEALRARLEAALAAAGATGAGDALFEELTARYAEPQRHYHTLAHVEACLDWLSWFAGRSEHPEEVALALWFHDAVYDPGASDNEARSASLMRARLLALGVSEERVGRVEACVLATRSHRADDPDGRLVVDLDLAVLGGDRATFDAFEASVRREYAAVPDALYVPARLRVLEGFLARPTIYADPEVRGELEARARANLERRVAELS